MLDRKLSAVLVLPCVLVVMAVGSTAWADSPYDMPYAVQWSFMIGNYSADNPNVCQVSPDGSVWIGTGGTGTTNGGGGSYDTLTWGNHTSSYGGYWASGYGQISPTGMILQGNDIPVLPGMSSGYSQGYSSTIAFAGSDPTAYVSWKPNSTVTWTDAVPFDMRGGKMKPMTMAITPLSVPYDYDGHPGGDLPIVNAAGIDPNYKFTHDLVNPGAGMGSAHDNAMGSDGSYYFVGSAEGSDPGNPPDTFTVGDFSGPYSASYKPFVGRVSADGSTLYGPAH